MSIQPHEIRLRQQMSRRIVATKISDSRKLLAAGHSVRYVLTYRTNEAEQEEHRQRLLGKIRVALQDAAEVQVPPTADGVRCMVMVLKPLSVPSNR